MSKEVKSSNEECIGCLRLIIIVGIITFAFITGTWNYIFDTYI